MQNTYTMQPACPHCGSLLSKSQGAFSDKYRSNNNEIVDWDDTQKTACGTQSNYYPVSYSWKSSKRSDEEDKLKERYSNLNILVMVPHDVVDFLVKNKPYSQDICAFSNNVIKMQLNASFILTCIIYF